MCLNHRVTKVILDTWDRPDPRATVFQGRRFEDVVIRLMSPRQQAALTLGLLSFQGQPGALGPQGEPGPEGTGLLGPKVMPSIHSKTLTQEEKEEAGWLKRV